MTTSPAKRLCIVIINYKTASLVLDCVQSVHKQLNQDLDHIVIVDNMSGGNDVKILREAIDQQNFTPFVTIIVSPENNGFSAGNNIGIKAIKARYYILANGDTLFRPNAVRELLQVAKDNPQAGMISPRLEWPDADPQISCFRYPTPFSELINSAATGIITNILKKYEVPQETVNSVTTPEWTSFACVLIRKEVFSKIGYMDERYFMYFEDIDFCRMASEAGFHIINTPKAHVVHLRGQSSGMKKMQRKKHRLPAYYYHSRSRYFQKFYGTAGLLLSNLCWLAGRSLSLVKELILQRNKTVPEYQFIDIWKKQ